jgi:hypothetical protein
MGRKLGSLLNRVVPVLASNITRGQGSEAVSPASSAFSSHLTPLLGELQFCEREDFHSLSPKYSLHPMVPNRGRDRIALDK